MPKGAIYVGRPTTWGNKFQVGHHYKRDADGGVPSLGIRFLFLEAFAGYQDNSYTTLQSAAEAVEWWRWYLGTFSAPKLAEMMKPLRGRNLACWCPLDQPCHADVLLELANAD